MSKIDDIKYLSELWCTPKEQETCNVEKMGCEGCYYSMDEKEVEKVLEELYAVRPEMLNDKAKRLFDAIMNIADERDRYMKRKDELLEIIEALNCDRRAIMENYEQEKNTSHFIQGKLDEADAKIVEQRKVIDLMAEEIKAKRYYTYVDLEQWQGLTDEIIESYTKKARENNEHI